MRRTLQFVLIGAVVLSATLAASEAGRRILDGYLVVSPQLVKDPAGVDLTWSDAGSIDQLMRAVARDPGVDVAWFYNRPLTLTGTSPAWADARLTKYDPAANYVWNAATLGDPAVQAYLQKHKGRLDEIFTFRSPDGAASPTYRFYPNVQSGYGFTNSFGWRSRPLEATKPTRAIRIGVLGDSTTGVYPRLVEHWLNLWAAQERLDIQFEIVNAARPASGALDAAAVLDFELGSVDPDYVVVYGFGNGVYVADGLVKLPSGVVKGQPPPANAATAGGKQRMADALGGLSRWSAAAGFLRGRILGQRGAGLSAEPAKPRTEVVFPPDISEDSPDPEAIAAHQGGGVMGLDTYLKSLTRIDQLVRARGIRLFVGTFRVTAFDGMLLDRADTHSQGLAYQVLNEQFWWPYTYAQIRRLTDFYNRALIAWSQAKGHIVVPINEEMPWRPDLYKDAMHEMPSGELLHAWIVLQHLIPTLRDDIASGALPRAPRPPREGVADYWKIAVTPVASVLDTPPAPPPAPAPSPASAPAEEMLGAFPLSALALAYDKAAIVPGDVPQIRTAPEPQAYAAAIPLSITTGQGASKGWVRVRLRVRSGRVSVGILNKSAQRFLATASAGQSSGLQQFDLIIDDLSDIGSLMISNDRPGEQAVSVVELHGAILMKAK